MAKSAYKCKIDLSFILDNNATPIDSQFLKYIIIDNNYESRSMPVIYISLALTNDIYTKLIENEKSAKIYFCLWKYNIYSGSSIYKKYIEGQFSYIRPTSDPNYSQNLVDTTTPDNSYVTVTLALLSMDILNKIKQSFNGIYGNVDQNTLICKALEGLPSVVVDPPRYNPTYDTINIPALNSKAKLLQFLYKECPFYDTNYIFFVDFKKSYLLDLSGKYRDGGDGNLPTVMFDIREVINETSYYEGMEEKNGAYYVHINPMRASIKENKATDKITNQVVFVDNDEIQYVDIDSNNRQDSTVKQSIVRGSDAILYKNILKSNTSIVELSKENLNSEIFTPNKEYIIHNYEAYSDNYNGNYTLVSKKEIIVNKQGEFNLSLGLTLRKVGSISSIGNNVVNTAERRTASSLHKYVSNKKKVDNIKKSNSGGTPTPRTSTQSVSTLSLRTSDVLPISIQTNAITDYSIKRSIKSLGEEV